MQTFESAGSRDGLFRKKRGKGRGKKGRTRKKSDGLGDVDTVLSSEDSKEETNTLNKDRTGTKRGNWRNCWL